MTAQAQKLIVCIHEKNKNETPVTLENPGSNILEILNKDGYGIFESVNTFLATKDEIEASKGKTARQKSFLKQLKEVYADLDVCKEEDSIDVATREEAKKSLKNAVDEYFPASYYVITKNGIQPHWTIDEQNTDEETLDKYKNVILGIIEWSTKHGSKGDLVYDVTRVLRLPGYFHNKAEPYLITEEKGSGKTYTLDELKKYFWHETSVKVSTNSQQVNDVYQKIDALDIKQVAIDVWKERGSNATFDNQDRLVVDGIATATFKGRLGGNYMATTSGDYPAKGNSVTYVAETLKMTNSEAFQWLCSKYNITNNITVDATYELPDFITAEELSHQIFSSEIWMIERLIPENQITILSAPPSSFKTMNALDWIINVANGDLIYNHFKTLQSNVLYLTEDGDCARIFQKRIRLLHGDFPKNLYLSINKGFDVTDEKIEALIRRIKKYNIKFIVLDSLRGIIPFELDEMIARDIRQFVNRLRPLVNVGATILIIHHDRKKPAGRGYTSKDTTDIGEMMSGSGDIRGAVDCHLSIKSGIDKKDDKKYVVVTQTKCREEELLPPFKVYVNTEFDSNCEKTKISFSYEGDPPENNAEETLNKAKESIEDFLANSSEKYVWRDDIAKNKPGGLAERTLEKALKIMEDEDKTITSISGKELGMKSSSSRRKYYALNDDVASDSL